MFKSAPSDFKMQVIIDLFCKYHIVLYEQTGIKIQHGEQHRMVDDFISVCLSYIVSLAP